jgi:hypothetical protein
VDMAPLSHDIKKKTGRPGVVVHLCNPKLIRGQRQEDQGPWLA